MIQSRGGTKLFIMKKERLVLVHFRKWYFELSTPYM